MRDGDAAEEEGIERIARARAQRLVEVGDCIVRAAIQRQRESSRTQGGRKIRIEIERIGEVADGLLGAPTGKLLIAQRHMGPSIALIELGGTKRELRGEVAIRACR